MTREKVTSPTMSRSDLLDNVRSRLRQFASSGDPHAILAAEAVVELAGLLGEVDVSTPDIGVLKAAGWLHWYRYHALPDGDDQPDLERSVLLFCQLYAACPEDLPELMRTFIEENPPSELDYRQNLLDEATWIFKWALRAGDESVRAAAQDLLARVLDVHGEKGAQLVSHTTMGNACKDFFRDNADLAGLDVAIDHFRLAFAAAGDSDADLKSATLVNLADALHDRFTHIGQRADLDEAIGLARQAATTVKPGAAHHGTVLHNLAMILVTAYEETGAAEHLTDAVELLRRATERSLDPSHLSSLAYSLRLMYESTNLTPYLDEAVTVARQSVELFVSSGVGLAVCLSRLGQALQARFESTGATTDLDEAVECHQRAVAALPEGHVHRVPGLSNLSSVLQERFELTGAADDLDEAIRVNRQALDLTPPGHSNRAAILTNLAVALRARHGSSGSPADLDEAIAVNQRAIDATPEGHPDLPGRLTNLSVALEDRFQERGALLDIEEAVQSARGALDATSADHPRRAAFLSNLGNALQGRHIRTGAESDLDEAIECLRLAVDATPAKHSDYVRYVVNFGLALRLRFERRGVLADLGDAVSWLRQGVQAAPASFIWRPAVVSNLGIALQTRFERTGSHADLDDAISCLREAASSMDVSNVDLGTVLTNLSDALQSRFSIIGSLSDLEEAVRVGQRVLEASPEDHPNRSGRLSNLGNALRALYERTHQISDLDHAVTFLNDAAATTPADDPARVGHLSNLGITLLVRATEPASEQRLADLDNAIQALRAALDGCPYDHGTRYSIVLSNLGAAIIEKLKATQDGKGVEELIDLCRRAVAASPKDHPDRAKALTNLGEAFEIDFRANSRAHASKEAVLAFREALLTETARPAGRRWAPRRSACCSRR